MPGADVLQWMWDNRAWIVKQLGSLAMWVKQPSERPILILGPGGCGKSTLLRILAGHRDWLTETPWKYAESTQQEKQAIEDDPDVQIIVTPGQPHREKTYWQELQGEIAAGKYRGIVLLTAYGYHSLGQGMRIKNHPLYQAGVKQPTLEFLGQYLPDRRLDEIRVLKQLAPHLAACQQKIWLLSVVAKEDLWSDERPEVSEHYRNGAYGSEVAAIIDAKNVANFRTELSFVSLIINNFKTGTDELIKKNLEGYDHKSQVESVRSLVEVISGLRAWEAGS